MSGTSNYSENAYKYFYEGKYREALSLYYKILSSDLDNSINYYNVALVYDVLEEYELAVSYYKKSIRLDGSNIRSMNNLARIYIDEIKDYDMAEIYLNQSIQIAPTDAEAYNLFGNISILRKDFDLALRYLKKSTILDKNYFKNYYDIAICYYALDKFEEAKSNAEKSLELNPNFNKSKELLHKIQ